MIAKMQGEWRTGAVFINGAQLELQVGVGDSRRSVCRFGWGPGDGSRLLAIAILICFTRPRDAAALSGLFADQVVGNLPQTDFSIEIDVAGWVARERLATRVAAAAREGERRSPFAASQAGEPA